MFKKYFSRLKFQPNSSQCIVLLFVSSDSLYFLAIFKLGLRFGKVCEQKREQKHKKNAKGSKCNIENCSYVFSPVGNFLVFSLCSFCVFTCIFDTNRLVSKTRVKMQEKSKNASETKHSVLRPLQL